MASIKPTGLNPLVAQLLEEEPVQNWAQGANHLAKALFRGLELRDQKAKESRLSAALLGLPGLGGASPQAPGGMPSPMPSAAPQTPMPPSAGPGAPQQPAMLPDTPPQSDPTMSVSPRQVAMANEPPPASFNERFAASMPAVPGANATPVPTQAIGRPSPMPPAPMGPMAQAAPQQGGAQPPPAPQAQAPQIPPETAQYIRTLLSRPETREMGMQLYHKERERALRDPKHMVAGDKLYRIAPNGQVSVVADATKATEKERNLAAENTTRAQRGEPPLSMSEFEQSLQAAETRGKQQGEAQLNLPSVVARSQEALDTIRKIRAHPGKQYGTGVLGALPPIPGTAQAGFADLVNQAQGQTFLEAFQLLKGGGQITEIEGRKAEQAIARLNRARRPEDFDAALNDLESVVRSGMERARLKAEGQTRMNAASQPDQQRVRRYNPETGRIE